MKFETFLSKPQSRREVFRIAGATALLPFLNCVPTHNPPPHRTPTPTPRSSGNQSSGCLEDISEQRIRQIGRQGGYLNPAEGTYIFHNGAKVSYLCWDIPRQEYCRDRIRTVEDMEDELSRYIRSDLEGCSSETVSNVEVIVHQDETIVKARVGGIEKSTTLQLPLGRLYDVVYDIKRRESATGDFDTLSYSLQLIEGTNKPYMIQRLQPYPDELYICKIRGVPKGNEFIFQFAIEGEPR